MAEPSTILSINAASGAYRSSRDMPATAIPSAPEDQPSFSDMLANVGRDTVTSIREAEGVAQTGMAEGSDTQAVIEATLELESTVRVAVTVRDKLVEAYQEIMRMPV